MRGGFFATFLNISIVSQNCPGARDGKLRSFSQHELHLFARCLYALLFVIAAISQRAAAQQFDVSTKSIKSNADSALALLSFAVVPDLTTSFLKIRQPASDATSLQMTQFAGGFSLGKSLPLYVEGGVSYMRYDPAFVATNGTDQRNVPLRWNNFAATGGVGWDFPVTRDLVFRPIVNVALGQVTSDISLGSRLLSWKSDGAINFFDGGKMNAYGLGGSAMLAYFVRRADHEFEAEGRYTNIRLQTFGDTSQVVQGSADAITQSFYVRYRAPTGIQIFERPLRYVIEGAHTNYLGDQRGALGFDRMSSIGSGIEFDSSAYDLFVTRVRLVYRFAFGNNVRGHALGLAVSF